MLSTYAAYKRLFAYARPYRVRLAVGILAGVVFSGSLFTLLSASPKLFSPFSGASKQVAIEAAGTGSDQALIESSKEAQYVLRLADYLAVPRFDSTGRMTWQFFLLTLSILPIVILVWTLANYLNSYYMRWLAARIVLDLRNELFFKIESQSLKFFGKCDIGNLVSRSTNDSAIVEHVVNLTIADLATAPLVLIGASIFVVTYAAQENMLGLVAAMFLAFPLCIVPIVVLGKSVRRNTAKALDRISDLVSRMHETFTGIRVVKAFNTEELEREKFKQVSYRYFTSVLKALRAELFMGPLMEATGLLFAAAFLVVCYAKGIGLERLTPILLPAVIVYRPIRQLTRVNANIQRGAAALERIFALLDTDTSVRENPNPVAAQSFHDKVVFDRVTFAYGPEAAPAVSDICLDIPKGGVVALVGETGSGKSTIANLLARFYDPTAGRVLLDGKDVRDISISSLRLLIGVVTQETILFNDTIANNIAYGSKGVSMDRIVAAAKKANAHEFIIADPAGYDRIVGDKGFVLSGGERQRIAIARAIMKDAPILILDEATSALDTVTERLVQDAISSVMKDRTVLAIAHRLSTVRHANQILLLEHGRITERGNHEELYAAGGRYRMLCDMQVLG
ncbi:MAG: ABC transporter ATP-binding protein [bacterium]